MNAYDKGDQAIMQHTDAADILRKRAQKLLSDARDAHTREINEAEWNAIIERAGRLFRQAEEGEK